MSDEIRRIITLAEREALEHGYGYIHRGRVVPIISGGSGDGEGAEGEGEGGSGEGAGEGAAGDGTGQEGSARTFSQADLDRIVRDRLARQKAQYADYDDLKAAGEKLREIEEAQKTEIQKATEKADRLEKELVDAGAKRADALLRAAVVSEAAKKNVVDPDAAFALLDKSSLEYAEDGTPSNIADAMDSLLEAKPYLAGTPRAVTGSADQGVRGDSGAKQLTREDLKGMPPAEINKAKAEGRLNQILGIPG